MRIFAVMMLMGCQGGAIIDDGTLSPDTDTDTDTDTDADTDTDTDVDTGPPWKDSIGGYEGDITAVMSNRWGSDTECDGPFSLTVAEDGSANGFASCETSWTEFDGDVMGTMADDGQTVSGTWDVNYYNYTITIDFTGTILSGVADIEFLYEDDYGNVTEGEMFGEHSGK